MSRTSSKGVGVPNVWVLGAYQSDFARNLSREGLGVDALTSELVTHTLDAAGVGPDAIEVIHVGNAFGQLFTGQGHLGAGVLHQHGLRRPVRRHGLAADGDDAFARLGRHTHRVER